jgi:hypothetical protein
MRKRIALLLCALLCLSLCACGVISDSPSYPIDYGISQRYSQHEVDRAIHQIQREFSSWDGFEMHAIRYGGDEMCTPESLEWINVIAQDQDMGKTFTDCMCIYTDFHTPLEAQKAGVWISDYEYTDVQWWLGCTADGDWVLVYWG